MFKMRKFSDVGSRYKTGSNASRRPGSAMNQPLSKDTLTQFDSVYKPLNEVGKMKPIADENVNQTNKAMLPPRTPNYGKTPKYLKKYKEEAEATRQAKVELRAAKLRPPGTKLIDDVERMNMVEKLSLERVNLLTLLNKLPLQVETATLHKQKLDLERKLADVEKALETFSRKIVYVRL